MTDNPRNARLGIYGGFVGDTTMDGIDTFEHTQAPDFDPVDDLSRFVKARIIEAETEPRGEVIAMYDQPAGSMAHRYAGYVRRDMVVFRQILAQHLKHHDLTDAVRAIACRWADHRDFRDEWRLA